MRTGGTFCLPSRICGSRVTQKGRNSTEWPRKPRYQQVSNPCWNLRGRKGKPEKIIDAHDKSPGHSIFPKNLRKLPQVPQERSPRRNVSGSGIRTRDVGGPIPTGSTDFQGRQDFCRVRQSVTLTTKVAKSKEPLYMVCGYFIRSNIDGILAPGILPFVVLVNQCPIQVNGRIQAEIRRRPPSRTKVWASSPAVPGKQK